MLANELLDNLNASGTALLGSICNEVGNECGGVFSLCKHLRYKTAASQ